MVIPDSVMFTPDLTSVQETPEIWHARNKEERATSCRAKKKEGKTKKKGNKKKNKKPLLQQTPSQTRKKYRS